MKKKMVSVLLALAMCLGLAATACAADIVPEESEVPAQTEETIIPEESAISHKGIIEDEGIVRENGNIRASNAPSKHWNLGSKDFTLSFPDLEASDAIVTSYYFTTTTGNIDVTGKLLRSGTTTDANRTLMIELYEKEDEKSAWSLIDTSKVYFNTTEYTIARVFTQLDPDHFYYIRFLNDSTVRPGKSMAISAQNLTINE